MICQEDNTLRRERDYHEGLHCTIDPINKGTTTLLWKQRDNHFVFGKQWGEQRDNHFVSIIAFLDQNKVVVPFFSPFLSFLFKTS